MHAVSPWQSRIGVLLLAFTLVGCGEEAISDISASITEAPPNLSSVTPATAAQGATIALRGSGFSVVAQENVVWIGTESMVATNYLLLNPPTSSEIEEIQATLPASLIPGTYAVIVQTGDMMSNGNLNLTVTP